MEKLFERILRESNYGRKSSVIYVDDVSVPFKRIVKPINMMYPGDTIICNDTDFVVGDLIDKKEEKTVNKDANARGTRVFTISTELFETDDPGIEVKRIYDSFLETETIILIDNTDY